MTDISMTTRRTIKAPAKTLYDAWIDPARMAKFMCACDGETAQGVTADPRVGGRFHIPMPTPGGIVDHNGEYLELDPYSRIVFTWNSKHVNPGTVVTLTFDETSEGTEVVLTHEKFASEGMRDGHMKGWTAILDNFEDQLVA